MVACTCDPVAWWPLPPPFALHPATRCGAYLMPGEEVGRGWRSHASLKTWGPPAPRPQPDRGAA
ncbi:hypothetical protein C8263_04140 [Deinococcus arcticus]|uniref:Uncharacterized protein n=1 Tax=Deinococcus arcticus TaxID=2136176 RepID=A0A2T3WAS3_9DEIO|nr:hypothetical protein C8263_04140 [Deinococcus arcticus]